MIWIQLTLNKKSRENKLMRRQDVIYGSVFLPCFPLKQINGHAASADIFSISFVFSLLRRLRQVSVGDSALPQHFTRFAREYHLTSNILPPPSYYTFITLQIQFAYLHSVTSERIRSKF